MHGIGSLIREIDVNISEIWETNILLLLSRTNARILSVKPYNNNFVRVVTRSNAFYRSFIVADYSSIECITYSVVVARDIIIKMLYVVLFARFIILDVTLLK